ncbi:hypothetical protein ACSBR2_006953 [Camellia fascicularis]
MMDLRRGCLVVLGSLFFLLPNLVSANVVFKVQNKFAAARERTLPSLKAHDDLRHGRRLAAVDLPLGGNGSPTDTALYYTKIGIGTPSKDYYVQVDTGSDIMWVNCAGCDKCPTKSDLGPKLNSTPLVPKQAHYNVILKAIEVGHDVLQLPTDVLDSQSGKPVVIDSGTTLAYLADDLFTPLMDKIMAAQPDLKLHTVEQQFTCFQFNGNVDNGFPAVNFRFENSLSLTIVPSEYLFQLRDNVWCVGWQNGGMQSKDGKELTLLGDMVLSNKLVLYDLENQTIGWAKYNCSSSVKVRDDPSGQEYLIGYHDLASASNRNTGWTLTLLLLLAILGSFI